MSDFKNDPALNKEGKPDPSWWDDAKTMRIIHRITMISAAVAAIATELVGTAVDLKIGGYSIALILLAASQIVNKITNGLDHKETLDRALEEAVPMVLAATKGNTEQKEAVSRVIANSEKLVKAAPQILVAKQPGER